jgi:sarcosine oxidase
MSRIVVVGGGIVGLSVCRAALKRGHEVVLLEQGSLPNPQGASYDQHRMIRPHYGAHDGYARMVAVAFAAWEQVWADIGAREFEDVGAIAVSLEPDDYADRTLASFRRLGIPHEVLDWAGVERLCPQLVLPHHAWGVTSGPAGPLFAGRIVTALVRWAAENGADLRPGTAVADLDPARAAAILSDGTRVAGDHLVVAAGAWLPKLLPERYAGQPTYRQALVYVRAPEPYAEAWRRTPAIAAIGDSGAYTLPDVRGAGLKFGWGGHRRRGAPEETGYGADLAAESQEILAAFRPFLRNPDGYVPERMQVGFYVMDDSRRFRLDALDEALVVTNCDGQMFKFGPVIGDRIVAAFEGAETRPDLARWASGH